MSKLTTLTDADLDAVSGGYGTTINIGNGGIASNGAQIGASFGSYVSVGWSNLSVNGSTANANGGKFFIFL